MRDRFLRGRQVRTELASESPESAALHGERATQVRRAVARLPSKYREGVTLYYLEEMTTERVAEVLGIARNTVEVRLSRARKQLARTLRTDVFVD